MAEKVRKNDRYCLIYLNFTSCLMIFPTFFRINCLSQFPLGVEKVCYDYTFYSPKD